MATYSKKRRVEGNLDEKEEIPDKKEDSDSSLDDDEEGYEDDSPHEEINEEVQVEFEALPPQDDDFHGIKILLQQLFLKSKVNISELSNLVLSQNHVGSVLKQSEAQLAEESDSSDDDDNEDHVYGIITVINISDKRNESCIKDVQSLLEEKCSKCAPAADQEQFVRTLNDPTHSVGLMLNERFVNIPPQLAPPLHKSLQKDLQLASRKNPKFKFDYFLLICKSYREDGNSQPAKSKKKKKTGGNTVPENELLFSNAEDEYFHKAALLSFEYPVSAESDSALGGTWSFDDIEYKTYRTVMIVPASNMPDILSQIEENLSV
ncbi:BRCA2 and CDKN1A-interacting protein-like [Patiria miniata]|uniref:Protein BCCIP homolog n=1 Tax=Patiria miniata TaxID=46514 RepID=A0A914B4V9_PATMI|nr:BRCA2 and CDKN1A-interacting protein-like [Patiria miniata]